MNTLEKLKSVGQSLWFGQLSCQSVRDASLIHAIDRWSVTGLAFSPQAIGLALSETGTYDSAIARKIKEGFYGANLANTILYEDVRYAADLLRPIYDRTDGVDGWAVSPVSPLSTAGNHALVLKYKQIYEQIKRPNTLLCLPAFSKHLPDIEELVYAGVPLNIANVYSDKQYAAVAKSCLTGLKRRLKAGLKPNVSTFITINIARLEAALTQKTDFRTATSLAEATARKIYRTMRETNNSQEWGRTISFGARPLRLVWSYCGQKQTAEDGGSLSCRLIAPYTVLALPGKVISEFVTQSVDKAPMPLDGDDGEQVLTNSIRSGLDIEFEADRLQREYTGWLTKEWAILLESFARRSAAVIQLPTAMS
jgi:transaldolase